MAARAAFCWSTIPSRSALEAAASSGLGTDRAPLRPRPRAGRISAAEPTRGRGRSLLRLARRDERGGRQAGAEATKPTAIGLPWVWLITVSGTWRAVAAIDPAVPRADSDMSRTRSPVALVADSARPMTRSRIIERVDQVERLAAEDNSETTRLGYRYPMVPVHNIAAAGVVRELVADSRGPRGPRRSGLGIPGHWCFPGPGFTAWDGWRRSPRSRRWPPPRWWARRSRRPRAGRRARRGRRR